MKWEYRTVIYSAQADDPEAKAHLESLYPGWEPPRFAPQALVPKLNAMGAKGWELVSVQPVYMDADASVLIHGGPSAPDDALTRMVKTKARIPSSSPGMEPTRYTHSYLCAFKRQVESDE